LSIFYEGYFWVVGSEPAKPVKEYTDLDFITKVREVKDRYQAKCGINVEVWHSDFMEGFGSGYWVVFTAIDDTEAGLKAEVGSDHCSQKGVLRAGAASYPGFLGACADDLERCAAAYGKPDGNLIAGARESQERYRAENPAASVLAGNPAGADSCALGDAVFESQSGNYRLNQIQYSAESSTSYFDLKPRYGTGTRFIGEIQWKNGASSPRYVLRVDCRSVLDSVAKATCEKSPGVSNGNPLYGMSRRGEGLRDVSYAIRGVEKNAPHFLLFADLGRNTLDHAYYPSVRFENPGELFTFQSCR